MVLYGGQSVPMELRGQFKHPGVRLFTWAEFLAQASSTPQDLVRAWVGAGALACLPAWLCVWVEGEGWRVGGLFRCR